MVTAIAGIVHDGLVVPDQPLPEGARVEIMISDDDGLPPELEAEFAAWDRASDRALWHVEELAAQEERDDAATR
jgi:hypothetical protein